MSDENPTPDLSDLPVGEVVMEPTRLQRFVINHPVASRWVLIVLGAGTAAGAALAGANVNKNRHHVEAAKDHVLEAGSEIVEAVSPTSQETPA
jgi:hypothetical protein